MADGPNLGADTSDIQAHISIIQGVIQRMAENSRYCKLWCVTLVSAVLFFVARSGSPEYTLITLIPLLLFLILDAYYLALEQGFRGAYEVFIRKLHVCELTFSDLYVVEPNGSIPKLFFPCLLSFSIYVFYGPLTLTILLVWWLVIR